MTEPAPLPGEPRPDLSERLRDLSATRIEDVGLDEEGYPMRCIVVRRDVAAIGAEAADALDAQAQRVAVLESALRWLVDEVDCLHLWPVRPPSLDSALAEAREAVPPEAGT